MSVRRKRRKKDESEHALEEKGSAEKNNTERALKNGEGKKDQYTKKGPFNFQIFFLSNESGVHSPH